MACSSPPPAKRARRSCRTFEMSPAVAQAPPVYTNLSDVRPGPYYNLRCRVSFVSLAWWFEQSGRAQGTLGARGHEHSCAHEDDCTWHKRLCGCQRSPVLVDITDRDGFRVTIVPEDQEDQFQIPAAPPMRTSGFGTLGADENGICNFLAKVKYQGEKDVT
eukprot:2242404-Amphidinium_carterae.1